jgi:hypothetical protein
MLMEYFHHCIIPNDPLDLLDIPPPSKHNDMKYRTYQIMHPHPSSSFALSLLHNPKRSPNDLLNLQAPTT